VTLYVRRTQRPEMRRLGSMAGCDALTGVHVSRMSRWLPYEKIGSPAYVRGTIVKMPEKKLRRVRQLERPCCLRQGAACA
jgi:hypothetical protein